MEEKVVRNTYSLCPYCLRRLPAKHVQIKGNIYLQKECPEHGFFSTIIWRGNTSMSKWIGNSPEIGENENMSCPTNCGICSEHLQGTCCTLLEVTKRCNLDCRFCFACERDDADPDLDKVSDWLKKLVVPGKTLVQLSGGEPTVRDDLPEIVAAAKKAGCKYIQLNSNGLRLSQDVEYVKELSEAGLSFVFMQFDGTEDEIYRKLRGRDLLEIKKKAIENCSAYNIGVTLVPTIVPGVNTHNIGDIIKFAVKNSPAVRGVHFQPVSYFGRVPEIPEDNMRYTLDELLANIEKQTKGLIKADNLLPSCCDHPLCGFHGDFVILPNKIIALSKKGDTQCCGGSKMASADSNREFVGRRWKRSPGREQDNLGNTEFNIHDMDFFLKRVRSHGFTITAMAFQDAGNIDLERLRRCSLHVFDDGRLVPFCSYYLTPWNQY